MRTNQKKLFTLSGLFQSCNRLQLSVYRKGQQNQQSNTTANQNKLFLIFGITTSGKTVTQYFLCQDELEFGMDDKTKVRYLVPVKQYLDAAVLKASNMITTRCPNVRAHSQPQSKDEQGRKVVFVQIPDMKQLMDAQKTFQYLFIAKILKKFSDLHLLIILTQQSLDDGASLIQSFQCITSVFDIKNSKVQQKLSTNLSIIINKSDPKNDCADVKEKLQDLINDVIQEENQPLFNIIDTIIRDQRVYIIKEEQPQEGEQKELFQEILEKSECGELREIKVNYAEIEDLVPGDDEIDELVEKVGLLDMWLESCVQLFTVTKYLSEQKNRQENHPVMRLVLNQKIGHFLQQTISDQLTHQQDIQFNGKLLPKVRSALRNLVKQLKTPKQQQSEQPLTITTLKKLLIQVKHACLQQVGIFFKQQIKQPLQSVNDLNTTKQPPQTGQQQDANVKKANNVFYQLLAILCNELCIEVEYMEEVLDYVGEQQTEKLNVEQEKNNHDQEIKFKKESLVGIVQQMITKLKEEFSSFSLSWLSSKPKGTTKSPRKSPRKKQYINITYTIQNLKQNLLKTHKSKHQQYLLSTIFSLPITHFKLYMLCLQLPSDLSALQKFIEQSFMRFRQIIWEIADVLRVGKMFVQQIMFLMLVPDWNAVEKVVGILRKLVKDRIVKKQRKEQVDFLNKDQIQSLNKEQIELLNKEQIDFLNKVGVYAKQMYRQKLSQKIFILVDQLMQKIPTPDFKHQLLSLRTSDEPLMQKLFQLQALQLYGPQVVNSHPKLVEMFKAQQQKIGPEILRANQFIYLVSQENL